MTQEDKELLLQDLCARLPYGVVVNYNNSARPLFNISPTQHFQITLDNGLNGNSNGLIYISLDVDGAKPKPYLRPISSMTEEEREEYKHLVAFSGSPNGAANFVDWLNKKMFAYRTIDGKDMFELGLAFEAPEGMYNVKEI